jgi:hypothetical protein
LESERRAFPPLSALVLPQVFPRLRACLTTD